MDEGDIYKQLQNIFGKTKGNFRVMEEQIDLNLQLEYFEQSREAHKLGYEGEVDEDLALLLSPEAELAQKKERLNLLAASGKVEAYRAVERYLETPDPSLRHWAMLAQQELEMLLESSLLDEKQIFISTGLGGNGNRLRYFAAVWTHEKTELSPLQEKIIRSEFSFVLEEMGGQLEELETSGYMALLLVVIPMTLSVRDVFQKAIGACNFYGDFLGKNFLITNVKKLSAEEVEEKLNAPPPKEGAPIDPDAFEQYDDDEDDD